MANILACQLNAFAKAASEIADTILRETEALQGKEDERPGRSAGGMSTEHRLVYGLNGICELFGVSRVTAIRYKNTWLKPAVSQRGKTIITDAGLALQLFADRGNGDG